MIQVTIKVKNIIADSLLKSGLTFPLRSAI